MTPQLTAMNAAMDLVHGLMAEPKKEEPPSERAILLECATTAAELPDLLAEALGNDLHTPQGYYHAAVALRQALARCERIDGMWNRYCDQLVDNINACTQELSA